MIDNFDRALEMVLEHEGLFSNHSADPGGATMRGVTKKTFEDWVGREVTIDEMKALTVDDVAPIYKVQYWDRIRADDIDGGLDVALFDWAVNSGTGRSAKAIQEIAGVTADGAIGPVSLKAIADLDTKEAIEELYKVRETFYRRLSAYETFGRGWSRRNLETAETAKGMVG